MRMGTEAVGSYLKFLRNKRGMTLQQVADASDTSVSQISRIEGGEQETRGSVLLAFTRTVGGSPYDVTQLMLDKDAGADAGEEAAKSWLHTHPKDQEAVARFFMRQPPCQVCGETTWRVGATFSSPVVDPKTGQAMIVTGARRVMLQIVCRVCGQVLLFDTGEIPAVADPPIGLSGEEL